MIDLNWKPTDKDLRVFATAALVVALIFSVTIYTKIGVTDLVKGLLATGGAVFALGMVWPRSLKYLYIGLSILAFPIGFVVGNVLMALVYYLLVTPIGLIFKLLGKDLLHRKLDPQASTYWIKRPPPSEPARYFRQF